MKSNLLFWLFKRGIHQFSNGIKDELEVFVVGVELFFKMFDFDFKILDGKGHFSELDESIDNLDAHGNCVRAI